MTDFIALDNIHKTYGKPPNAFEALRGISCTITQGEFVALMGPSGSGKSTLANILGCLDSPTSGIYTFQGVNISHLNLKQKALLRRHYIGFIFQGFNLLPRTTALENVELPLLYRQVPKKERLRLSMEALEMVGLEKWHNHQSNALSGGQQQRVAIARAIASKPLFLLADEPTGNLDTKRSVEIMEILKRLNTESHITILMVTHEPDMAQYATRKIAFLDGLIQSDSALSKDSILDCAIHTNAQGIAK